MKIRTDYVSNSSSSSFILKDVGFFKYFGITKKDICSAIAELRGCGGNNIFCVYDMTDEKDREECYKEWDEHFSWWYAPNEGDYNEWSAAVDMLTWKCGFSNLNEVLSGEEDELKMSVYDRNERKDVVSVVPGGAEFVKLIKNSLKVKTMKEVLHSKDCTMMIHFNDNEVHNVKGMCESGKMDARYCCSDKERAEAAKADWESESYSADRFFEILIKYFIEKGKVNLNDPNFLEYWAVEDDDTWFKEHNPGRKYYLEDDVATCKDVVDDCLRCNAVMHEG